MELKDAAAVNTISSSKYETNVRIATADYMFMNKTTITTRVIAKNSIAITSDYANDGFVQFLWLRPYCN